MVSSKHFIISFKINLKFYLFISFIQSLESACQLIKKPGVVLNGIAPSLTVALLERTDLTMLKVLRYTIYLDQII